MLRDRGGILKVLKIFRKIVCFMIIGVLISTPISSVKASTGSSTSISSTNGGSVGFSGGQGSGSGGWKYWDDEGYKMTTYILATTDLEYMNSLPSSMKETIVKGREGMVKVCSNSFDGNVDKMIKKYTSSVSYFGKGSQTYISDYYQQLGNGMSIMVSGSNSSKPGHVGTISSPKYHLSRYKEKGGNQSDYKSEISKDRAVKAGVKVNDGKATVSLGNYCDLRDSEWLTIQNFNTPRSVETVQNVAGSKGFLQYAIASSMANGLFTTGVSCKALGDFGITVKKESGARVSEGTVKVTELKMNDKKYAFSMTQSQYEREITVKGKVSNTDVKFTCKQVDLLNTFLSKYKINGESYTWEELCVANNADESENYGLNVSVVVILEPLKLSYNDSRPEDNIFMSLRERAYLINDNSNSSGEIDEKYSAGLCLNSINSSGLNNHEINPTKLIVRLNSMMYSKSSYAEFPPVEAGSGSRCGNNSNFMYNSNDRDTNSVADNVNSVSSEQLAGGIACIGYYHEMDLDSSTSVNPFPSLAVRHIDNTALGDTEIGTLEDSSNVLMRDTITWTVPSSIGLAIENDVAKASFLTENKGLYFAYGGNDSSISYKSVDEYAQKAIDKNGKVENRFGTSDASSESKLELLKQSLNYKDYNYNGITVSSMSFSDFIREVKSKSGLNTRKFMQTVKKADKGDTEARSDYYSWCMDVITEYYSQYSVRIPLLRNENNNLSTRIGDSNTFWGISAKPLASCSGNYEYYDGAIRSADVTRQRKVLANSVEKLVQSNVSNWDSISARDTETGSLSPNVIGETDTFIDSCSYPGLRAASVLDYYVNDGVVVSNVTKNSKKSKINFYYGSKFKLDRKLGSNQRGDEINIAKSIMSDGGFDSGDSVTEAYLPSAKVIKSYADVMYDVSVFNNSFGFMQSNVGQSVSNLVNGATQLRSSNEGGKLTWPYLVFPEYSLGSRMLMGNDCTNSVVDYNVYSDLNGGSSDISEKSERETKESLMAYWNSTSYETHGTGEDVNIRDNMFFGDGDSKRGFNTVWVPDLGNNGANLNSASISSGDGENGGQTATGKMFTITEKIYGITLAYNPNMSSAEGWTYRIANGYTEEAKDINTNDQNNIPAECIVKMDETEVGTDVFSNRCLALGVDEVLNDMPGPITELDSINKDGEVRNFIKYTNSGWKFLNGKFSNKGVKKYAKLTGGNATYTLNPDENTRDNGFYIDINVGDWISYGDLGTLDAYYDTFPASKIYDLSLDVDTDEEGMNGLNVDSLLLTEDYEIKNSELSNGFVFDDYGEYNMVEKAEDRGFDNSGRRYIGTVKVDSANLENLEVLTKLVSSGSKCLERLRSGEIIYSKEGSPTVNLWSTIHGLEDGEVVYYINIWAEGGGSGNEEDGDVYIRSDELVSAARVEVPNDTLMLEGYSNAPTSCGTSGHTGSKKTGYGIAYFMAQPRDSSAWKVMGGDLIESNPFTVFGKKPNGNKKIGIDWIDASKTKWEARKGNESSQSVIVPQDLSVGVLLHRSMVSADDKEYSKTPPLASYMNSSLANKKYKEFCDEYDVPVQSDSGITRTRFNKPYGWSSSGGNRELNFRLFNSFNVSANGDMQYFSKFDQYYECVVNNLINTHSVTYVDQHIGVNARTLGSGHKKVDVKVEDTYVANESDSDSLKPELYAKKVVGGTDSEIVYKVPTEVEFTPTYLMRSDYDVENYEVDNVAGSAKKQEGNREKVWVLGSKKRTMNVHNLYSIKITGAEQTKVQAPWSTDNRDKQNYDSTGKPTVKAGSVYKLSKTAVNLQVQSVVYLLDESFFSGSALDEVKDFNKEAISAHNELLEKVKGCSKEGGDNGSYNFIYTSLPGGYDENIASKYSCFTNKFTNVVKGSKHEYEDSQFSKVFNKTKVKPKVNYSDIGTTISASYLNKEYDGDSDYTSNDYEGTRGMQITIDGKNFNLNPSALNVTSDVLLDNPVDEVSKSKNDALRKYYSQLEKSTDVGMSWYKEDFEGVLQVTITSNIPLQLDSDYSIIWNNLSDWQDKTGVRPYEVAKPSEIEYNGDSDVKIIDSNPNITSKIPAGEIGAGYGFLIDDVELNGVDFGTACMMLQPYMFEVRGNIYDDVSK